MKKDKMITEKENDFLTEHLDNPKMPTFYGLPKIHKEFMTFPPLRPNIDRIQIHVPDDYQNFLIP